MRKAWSPIFPKFLLFSDCGVDFGDGWRRSRIKFLRSQPDEGEHGCGHVALRIGRSISHFANFGDVRAKNGQPALVRAANAVTVRGPVFYRVAAAMICCDYHRRFSAVWIR